MIAVHQNNKPSIWSNCVFQGALVAMAMRQNCFVKIDSLWMSAVRIHPEENICGEPTTDDEVMIILAGPVLLSRLLGIPIPGGCDELNFAFRRAREQSPEDPLAKVNWWIALVVLKFQCEPLLGYHALQIAESLMSRGVLRGEEIFDISISFFKYRLGTAPSPVGPLEIERDETEAIFE